MYHRTSRVGLEMASTLLSSTLMRSSRSCLAVMLTLTVALTGCHRRSAGPNDAYRDPRMSAAVWRHFFEDPGRGEIYTARAEILRLSGVAPGMVVADVGAGTGLFTMMLSDAVGPDGRVYAEEVVDRFTRSIAERAEQEGRTNVVSVAGTERGIGLPPGSIDLAFLCDVYHHFDDPAAMLASIRQALRPHGQLFLVDFRREPGRSPDWVLTHVRAPEEAVIAEIEQAGFVSVAVDHHLHDSYAIRFRRRDP
jgi:SAM-dependent methyltransferase